MTPEQLKLVDLFFSVFSEVVPPTYTEPFYFDQDDFEALRAMWEDHKTLQAKVKDLTGPIKIPHRGD